MSHLNIAAIVPQTEAEGPGSRFAIWVQGCPLRCAGCCNPHYLEFKPAMVKPVQELLHEILTRRDTIEGITFIGGEPFSQALELSELARGCHEAGLSVMTFSGHTWEDLQDASHPEAPARAELLRQTDLLVAGPFVAAQLSHARRWIGSDNQTLHFLTERYQSLEHAWPRGGNTIELRFNADGISINGFPHHAITRLARNSIQSPIPKP